MVSFVRGDFMFMYHGKRVILHLTGLATFALGIVLLTKTGLGASPVGALTYNLSNAAGIPLAVSSYIVSATLILLAVMIGTGKKDRLMYCAAFITSMIFGSMINL